jgi:hypothetical protein
VPEFGVPEFGVPEFGVPEFGVPEFGVPEFGVPAMKGTSVPGGFSFALPDPAAPGGEPGESLPRSLPLGAVSTARSSSAQAAPNRHIPRLTQPRLDTPGM